MHFCQRAQKKSIHDNWKNLFKYSWPIFLQLRTTVCWLNRLNQAAFQTCKIKTNPQQYISNSFLTIWISSIQNCKPLLSSVCASYRKGVQQLSPFINCKRFHAQHVLGVLLYIPWMFTIIGWLWMRYFTSIYLAARYELK